jgi:hypothetical protein
MAIFDDAVRKIDRAKTHIRDVKVLVDRLQVSNTSRIDINPQAGGEILVHDIGEPTVFDDLALSLGDAIHNLNCALDYIWLQTIEVLAPSLVDDRAKMPVRKYAKEVEGWLTSAGIDSSSNFFKFVVNTIKPYSGGNNAIWAIHNFDIRDKHRLLIPILSQGWITGIVVVDQRGERWPGTGTTSEFQRPPYVIPFEPGLHVKEQGELAVDIVVTDDKSGCEMSVPEELVNYTGMVSRTLVLFQQFLKVETGG